MANSDWARESPEISWEYFAPAVGDFPRLDWMFSWDHDTWFCVQECEPVSHRDRLFFWRKPSTTQKGT